MNLISLQSGSNGNCLYVEAGGVRLLFDAGISGKQAKERLAARGGDITRIDALIISHEHRDHAACAGIYQRKFGMPMFISGRTLRAAKACHDLGVLGDVHHFRPGGVLRFGAVRVETFQTPHDGVDGSAFIVDDGTCRLGIFTDLGHVYGELKDALASVDAAVLESNYDTRMLETGSYPPRLRARIRGPQGHLSNREAAELVALAGSRLRWVCLAHLSEENNTPELVLRAHREIAGSSLKFNIAGRYGATGVIEV